MYTSIIYLVSVTQGALLNDNLKLNIICLLNLNCFGLVNKKNVFLY